MKELLNTFMNKNARWRFTHSIGFKLVTGCLGFLFITACIGTLVVIYLMPAQ